MKPNHPLKRGRQLEDSTILLMKILSDKRIESNTKKRYYKTRKRKLTRRQESRKEWKTTRRRKFTSSYLFCLSCTVFEENQQVARSLGRGLTTRKKCKFSEVENNFATDITAQSVSPKHFFLLPTTSLFCRPWQKSKLPRLPTALTETQRWSEYFWHLRILSASASAHLRAVYCGAGAALVSVSEYSVCSLVWARMEE